MAVINSLASDEVAIVAVATSVMQDMLTTAVSALGGRTALPVLPLVGVLTHLACISCFRREWLFKAAGCAALSFLLDKMDVEWLLPRVVPLSRVRYLDVLITLLQPSSRVLSTRPRVPYSRQALLFATMDLAAEVGGSVIDTARDLFLGKLVPRAVPQGTELARDGVETDAGRLVKLLAQELSSPDHHVRAQVIFCHLHCRRIIFSFALGS